MRTNICVSVSTTFRTLAITSKLICRPSLITSPPVIASPGPTFVKPTSCENRNPGNVQHCRISLKDKMKI